MASELHEPRSHHALNHPSPMHHASHHIDLSNPLLLLFADTHNPDVVSVAGIGLAWSTLDPESEHTRFEVIAPSSHWINKAGSFFYNSRKFWEWDENSATGLGLDWLEWSNLDTTLLDLLTTDPINQKFLDAKYQNRCVSLLFG